MPKADWISVATAAIFLAATVVGMFLLTPFPAILCAPDEAGCFREWVGALSGYVAAGAAGFTILVLLRQLHSQQQQTAFVVGDTEPSYDLFPHERDEFAIIARIVNWNRRTLLIEALDIQNAAIVLAAFDVRDSNGNVIYNMRTPTFEPPLRLDGWEDRQKAPSSVKITLYGKGTVGEIIQRWSLDTVIQARFRLLDSEHIVFHRNANWRPSVAVRSEPAGG